MSTLTIAVDLAKNVFELAIANGTGAILDRKRLSRKQFQQFWAGHIPCKVVMEACAGSYYWARELRRRGFEIALIPPTYVGPYRRRSKTDRTDCEALLEAYRCAGIHPVTIKSEDQQALIALHRVRAQWMSTRTARINALRALLYEFGVHCPSGPSSLLASLHELLEIEHDNLPARVRQTAVLLWEEIREIEARTGRVDTELECIARSEPTITLLMTIPGIGVLTATALYASVPDIHTFTNGRQLACWLGLTPREFSSGSRRRMGGISKQGDGYLRMLLIHGARSLLVSAHRTQSVGKPLSRYQIWALERASQTHHNKAAVAVANKLARIVWAVWYHERKFDGNYAAAA